MIEYYLLALIFGLLIAYIRFKYLCKKEDKKMMSNIPEKIMKQDKTFIIDGRTIDFKGDVAKGVSSPGVSIAVPKVEKPKVKLLEKASAKKSKVVKKVKKKVKKK